MAKSKAKLISIDSPVSDDEFDRDFSEAVDDARKGGVLSFAIVVEHMDRTVTTSWRSSYRGDVLRLGGALEKLKARVLGYGR